MKDKIKTITAFTVLGILIITTIVLTLSDRSTDVYPNDSTRINLYGEAHGSKTYYDIEFNLWKEYYGQGYRDLFLELPYYSAEFLNLWMQADSDELIDQFFEEIQGTQSEMHIIMSFSMRSRNFVRRQCSTERMWDISTRLPERDT